jgi:hypothetical protein
MAVQIAIWGMVGAAGLAFILAVIGSAYSSEVLGTPPEAYSRASNNLALLAIAAWLCLNGKAGARGDS